MVLAGWSLLLVVGAEARGAAVFSFAPDRGPAGTVVTVNGSLLQTAVAVYFGSTEAAGEILSRSASQVQARVPPNALSGPITVFTSGSGAGTSSQIFVAAPRIEQVEPASGGPGTVVTLTGANFGTTTIGGRGFVTNVSFNGARAVFQVNGINQLVAVVPTNATTGPITVGNEAGSFTTLLPFQVPAVISSFTPFRGMPGDAIEVRGSNLGSALRVEFGVAAAHFAVQSPSVLTVVVPTNAVTSRIQVTTPAGISGTSSNFHVLPRVIRFNPASGASGTNVVLEGGGFTGASRVTFNGTPATFQVDSSMRIRAVVPAGATTGPISVVTPEGTNTTTSLFHLPARVNSVTPTSGVRGTAVTVDGVNLNGATRVLFNGVEAEFGVVSPTRLATTVPALATTGRITVETPAGSVLSSGTFVVRPVLDSFTPLSGPVGTPVMLEGAGFTNIASVRLGDAAATFTVLSVTNIRAVVPLGAFSGKFRVRTQDGTEVVSQGTYLVDGARPTLTAMDPTRGPVGTTVVLSGSGFSTASDVAFNGTSADFTVLSSTQVRTQVPAGATTGRVAVTTLDGIAVSPADFVVGEESVRLAVVAEEGSILLSWPASAAGYSLQVSPVLGADAAWQSVPDEPDQVGDRLQLRLPVLTGGVARYYRLRR